MKKITLLIILITNISLLICLSVFGKDSNFEIKFGLMKLDANETYYVYTETTNIPYHLEETGFRFGYTIKNLEGSDFSTYFIICPPSLLKEYKFTHDIKNSGVGIVEGEGAVARIKPVTAKGEASFFFSFSKNDPLGAWKLKIYVNNKLVRVINFTVISPSQ